MPAKIPRLVDASEKSLLWITIKQLPKLNHSPRLFKRIYI
jgi:hypothetical protein